MTHIHILGICGTFMGGLAILARQLGFRVTGSDENVYPPMSEQLQQAGIELHDSYDSQVLKDLQPDCVVIGNALSRGNACIEMILSQGIQYRSGPQWLSENILPQRWVLAVAGTHGKTTTACMLAWILEYANMAPGYLIGGVPKNFQQSAHLGESLFFVIEADEYDTAFFDKRSKFVHYHPRTLILNNLEFDHADIFTDLAAIKTQFHHLLRIVPENGLIISDKNDNNLNSVINMGCWTPVEYQHNHNVQQNGYWTALNNSSDGSSFFVMFDNKKYGEVDWSLHGEHNIKNALAAIAAARHAGVPIKHSIDALCRFESVKRRMELCADVNTIRIYDDFAHHPTAIKTTLNGLRAHVNQQRIIAVLEARSNTMRLGVHNDLLADALSAADVIYVYQSNQNQSDLAEVVRTLGQKAKLCHRIEDIIEKIALQAKPLDHILIMSNGGFQNIHQRLIGVLSEKQQLLKN